MSEFVPMRVDSFFHELPPLDLALLGIQTLAINIDSSVACPWTLKKWGLSESFDINTIQRQCDLGFDYVTSSSQIITTTTSKNQTEKRSKLNFEMMMAENALIKNIQHHQQKIFLMINTHMSDYFKHAFLECLEDLSFDGLMFHGNKDLDTWLAGSNNKLTASFNPSAVSELEQLNVLGIDYWLSDWPMQLAMQGLALVEHRTVDLKHIEHAKSYQPIAADCCCHTCKHYTRSYLHHLFNMNEFYGKRLLLEHNCVWSMSMADETLRDL